MPTVLIKPKKKSSVQDPAAKAARLKMELAERDLLHFVRQAWHVIEPEEQFVDNWHIRAICQHLEAVTREEIMQLLINVPPGTMKSLLTCVFWPAWVWATQPGKRFMFSSYSETLSMRDSMRTRDLLTSEWYQERWPVSLKEDQNTKGRFDNDAGGWRIVGSVTGKGVGEHPDFNVGDDVHNVLQAESDAERATVTHWFEGVFCVRGVVRNVKRVLIGQRLHHQDAYGVALQKGGWVHLCLPMRYESPEKLEDGTMHPRMQRTPLGFQDPRTQDGELLWPAKYPGDVVTGMEANMGIYGTAGQLQQRPSPRGGGKFNRTWFEVLPQSPAVLKKVRYWDKAGTEGGTGARSSGVLMASYRDETEVIPAYKDKFIIMHAMALRKEAAEREQVIKQTATSDQATHGYVETWVEQEPGSGGKESADGTIVNLAGFTCKSERVTGSKEVRCDPLASSASVKKVKLLAGAWNQEFLDEIEAFPNGRLKDMVDAAGGAFNKLNTVTGAFGSGDAKSVQVNSLPSGMGRVFVPRQFTPRRFG